MEKLSKEEKLRLVRSFFKIIEALYYQPFIQFKKTISIIEEVLPIYDVISEFEAGYSYIGNLGKSFWRAIGELVEDDSFRRDLIAVVEGKKALNNYDYEALKSAKKSNNKQIINMAAISFFLLSLRKVLQLRSICFQEYKISIEDLIEEAKSGKKHAIYKLVSLDATFIYTDVCKKHIIAAEYSGDNKFKERLGEALSYKARTIKNRSKERTLVAAALLATFKYPGSYASWYDILAKESIMHYKSPKTFERACCDAGIPKPYPSERRSPH
jgi:hypothetical protein